jgi:hypothetical protein
MRSLVRMRLPTTTKVTETPPTGNRAAPHSDCGGAVGDATAAIYHAKFRNLSFTTFANIFET